MGSHELIMLPWLLIHGSHMLAFESPAVPQSTIPDLLRKKQAGSIQSDNWHMMSLVIPQLFEPSVMAPPMHA
jgi:hypothetical protein